MTEERMGADRAEYLSGRLAVAATRNDYRELANIALELVVLRNSAQSVLEGKYPKKEKEAARASLNHFRKLERRISQLYTVNLFRRRANQPTSPFTVTNFRRVKVPA